MKKLLMYVLILGGSALTTLSGCQKEEVDPLNTKKLTIFADMGTNPEIQNLVSYLKKNGDTLAFRQTFALQYGIPLWRNASVFGQGENTTMLVPLRDYDSNILSGIWVFEIKGSTIKYNVAINDICKPYYQQLKPFFKQIEQDIFGIYTKNTSYSLSKNTLKGRIGAGINYHCVITCTGGGDYLNCRDYCWSTVDIGGDSGGDNGGGGGGGNYTNPTTPPSGGTTPPADPKPEVDTKDPSFKDTKADCVFQKLVGSTSTNIYDPNSVVGKLLKDYWGKTSAGAHNLTFVVSPQSALEGSYANGQCEIYENKNVIIRISKDFMENCSNVEMARMLIHESIHAEIYIRQHGLSAGISTDSDFASLFDKYKNEGKQRDHNVMAESDYVKLIADGLKAYHDAGYMKTFDKNIAENNPNGFDMQQFYNMIAWSGLQNTKAYNSKDAAWKTVFNDQCNTARTNDAATCK